MSQLSHNCASKVGYYLARIDTQASSKLDILRQAAEDNPSPEINMQLQFWSMLQENIHNNAPIARAADW
eukprot:3700077-Prorocentrum_lima.AAC.1